MGAKAPEERSTKRQSLATLFLLARPAEAPKKCAKSPSRLELYWADLALKGGVILGALVGRAASRR